MRIIFKIFTILSLFALAQASNAQTRLGREQQPLLNQNAFSAGAGNDYITGFGNTAYGYHAALNLNNSTRNTCFGESALENGVNGLSGIVAIGAFSLWSATAEYASTAIGYNSLYGQDSSVSSSNTAIGYYAGTTMNHAHTSFNSCIFLGTSSGDLVPSNASNIFVVGAFNDPVHNVYLNGYRYDSFADFGSNHAGFDCNIHAMGCGAGDLNTTGGDLILNGGISSGNIGGGNFIFQTCQPGSSGTSDNALSEILRISSDGLILTHVSVPGSAGAAGTQGQIAYDSGFIYICVATNTWKRVAISSW